MVKVMVLIMVRVQGVSKRLLGALAFCGPGLALLSS